MLAEGISIGKAFGIPLRIHYSWFIVFVLVTWSLTIGYFPQAYPHWNLVTSIFAGVITSLLFFASVLVHELTHSLIARSAGIPIVSITLFIFGGVSQMGEEPRQPQVEFRMAFAGPLASLVLGGIFLAGWVWLRSVPQFEFVAAICRWLGPINIFLAAFNLIPGFPLDGGRVLRSLLWWRSGNLNSATKIASNVGRGIGYLLILGGIIIVFRGDFISGLWLAFIGWFLENAAAGSYRQLALQDMLKGHKVSELMTHDCPVVSPDMVVLQLVNEQILTSGRRCFPVVRNDRVLGLVTLHDIKAVPRDRWGAKTVGEVMTPLSNLKLVGPDEELTTALKMLTEQNINQLPVVKDGKIVGMVARDNLLSFISVRGELGAK
ncbi:MAG: CBS domain-containing protein [Chloroflexi bacterium]|nr:CBS domain-containing protein [Chloroflexota bacterium]MBM3183142.1 CBS domain-containing protein [Chloroflexota bacterium]MBM4451351.1 CBS domain-containing protein [Chloroflexota bacterium]MBM4453175.1 CBS domain-containing protein [Chloroflexota bacterium]